MIQKMINFMDRNLDESYIWESFRDSLMARVKGPFASPLQRVKLTLVKNSKNKDPTQTLGRVNGEASVKLLDRCRFWSLQNSASDGFCWLFSSSWWFQPHWKLLVKMGIFYQ